MLKILTLINNPHSYCPQRSEFVKARAQQEYRQNIHRYVGILYTPWYQGTVPDDNTCTWARCMHLISDGLSDGLQSIDMYILLAGGAMDRWLL